MAVKSSEKYYWLRLKDDFFTSKRIKKLRKLAGGDTFLIIYLKMQLVAMKNDGIIQYTGLEKSFAEELALDIDEDVDNVQVTLSYLLGCGLAESSDNINFFFPYAVENVGSETAAAQRMREARNKAALLPAPNHVNNVEQCSNNVKHCYTDIEKEKDTDKEKKKEKSICTTPESVAVLTLLLNDGSEYPISQEFIDKMKPLFPAVDVEQQLRSMAAWCINNPDRRKTKRGVTRFINSWLSREQDRGPRNQQNQTSGRKYTTASEYVPPPAPSMDYYLNLDGKI